MYFVLPGLDGAPIETLRYEALRMAVQDYELLNMVANALPAARARVVIDEAISCILRTQSLGDFAKVSIAKASELYSLDPADYHAARLVLIKALTE